MSPEPTRLIYVHDPMCSWCWGFRPVFGRLCDRLPTTIAVQRLLGGLAPDTDEPMPKEMQRQLQETWRSIQTRIPGTRFDFDFWHRCCPRRSTWPACRAVIAARALEPWMEVPMIEAIQHAYYLEARNPSDSDTLIDLAVQIGLDPSAFESALNAPEAHRELEQEVASSRAMRADSFPSLRLKTATGTWPVAVDYLDAGTMLDVIETIMDA